MTTIINHRNVGTIYTAWAVYLAIMVSSAGFIFWLQGTTPFNDDLGLTGLYVCVGVAVLCAVLSVWFKYIFKREIIAWAWLVVVEWVGIGTLLAYGWHWGLTAFIWTALGLLLVTGPYLYFE